jgi:hypothetical protein
VAGGVDGLYAREAEVPLELRLQKGRDEAAAGAVDVNGNVEAGFFLKTIESGAEREDVLIVSGKSAAENGDDADSVLVAGCGGARPNYLRNLPKANLY